jgi:hypothetical protein
MHPGDVFSFVECAISIFLVPNSDSSLPEEKKRLKQRGVNVFCIRSNLFASADVMEFQTTEAYSTLDLTTTKYNTSMHSRVE